MWAFQLWIDTSLAHIGIADAVAQELNLISDVLWGRPRLRLARSEVQDIPQPLVKPDELDWEAIDQSLGLTRDCGQLIVLANNQDLFLGDSSPEKVRIGLNLKWVLMHSPPEMLSTVVRGLIRHEFGHFVIRFRGRQHFNDPELDALDQLEWDDASIETRFDERLRLLEDSSQEGVVYAYGYHCLQPGCIMRQRASTRSSLGFSEIAECEYCELCRRTIVEPAIPDCD